MDPCGLMMMIISCACGRGVADNVVLYWPCVCRYVRVCLCNHLLSTKYIQKFEQIPMKFCGEVGVVQGGIV